MKSFRTFLTEVSDFSKRDSFHDGKWDHLVPSSFHEKPYRNWSDQQKVIFHDRIKTAVRVRELQKKEEEEMRKMRPKKHGKGNLSYEERMKQDRALGRIKDGKYKIKE